MNVEDEEDLAQGAVSVRATDQQRHDARRSLFFHVHPVHRQWPIATNDVAIGHCWLTLLFLSFDDSVQRIASTTIYVAAQTHSTVQGKPKQAGQNAAQGETTPSGTLPSSDSGTLSSVSSPEAG